MVSVVSNDGWRESVISAQEGQSSTSFSRVVLTVRQGDEAQDRVISGMTELLEQRGYAPIGAAIIDGDEITFVINPIEPVAMTSLLAGITRQVVGSHTARYVANTGGLTLTLN